MLVERSRFAPLAPTSWFLKVCIGPFIVAAAISLTFQAVFFNRTTYLPFKGSNTISVSPIPSFKVPGDFPPSAFSSYHIPPSRTQEPQPVIHDPVLNITYPLNLTLPSPLPDFDPSPIYFNAPTANLSDSEAELLIQDVISRISKIIESDTTIENCSKCMDALKLGQTAALQAPERLPQAMVDLCKKHALLSEEACDEQYAASNYGAIWTQVIAFADVSGLDGEYICNFLNEDFCPKPYTAPLDVASLFPKPKPANAVAPPAAGQRVKVLHLSDFHLDPRYEVFSEANCEHGLCCRARQEALEPEQISSPAPLYGAYLCDTPYYLALAALRAIGPLTGTGDGKESLGWSIYTGDLVSHDHRSQLSRLYVSYTETSVYEMFKKYISGPIFPALGNHDSNPEAIDVPSSLPSPLDRQMSWNYDHVARLWLHENWIDSQTADQARLHYGGYSIKNHHGLRIITLNTDFWYRRNLMNLINTTAPDNSGMLAFLIDELQNAEDENERVWITGHVPSGWDPSNALPNPSNLFYQVIERYSPHVIAGVFFGHTHQDQLMIYYSDNGTRRDAEHALTPGWICPSVTPLANYNSGFRVYEVDVGSFEIYEAYTYYADVSTFPSLDKSGDGPTFYLEYSTRDKYGPFIDWPKDAPLNATFWHQITEEMERDHSLVQLFAKYEGKSSIKTPECTKPECIAAKICRIRSANDALVRECLGEY